LLKKKRLAALLVVLATSVTTSIATVPSAFAASGGGLDPYGPAGMNVEAAHAQFTTGSPDVLVAYVEGGINWYGSNASILADSVYVNWHELPVPCSGSTMVVGGTTQPCGTVYSANESDYDLAHPDCVAAGDCHVTAADWAGDPRVGRLHGVSFVTPDDLIAAFSGAAYNPPPSPTDPAGYPKAISGWDFYDNQNDPATIDGAYGHANDQMSTILQMCPGCTILPVKAGDEAVDRTNDLARAWLFAAESGAKIIVSVSADLGYSSFEREVIRYIESKGIIVVEASNDFDTPDHQGGMFWNGVLPGNGLVANTTNLPQSVWSLPSVPGPQWTRSDLTSWGPHAMISVATGGGSTSESTPTLGGVLALVMAYGEKAYAEHLIPSPLTGPQAVSVLEASCSEPIGAPAGDWNELYGYGMPDELKAMQAIAAGDIPPAVSITSPSWYQLYDPTRAKSITVTGSVSAEPGQAFKLSLEYGLGADPGTPGNDPWHTLATATGTGSYQGTLGALQLSQIPAGFWERRFELTTGLSASSDEYAVTFRVVATVTGPGSVPLIGQSRLAVNVFHDPSAIAGFPTQIPSSGESQPALVDLQGSGHLDIVFGTSDGFIDAIDPVTGRELPGWPVHTAALPTTGIPAGSGIAAGYQPIVSNVAVGDLSHTGHLDVVATSTSGEVYAFDSTGRPLPGWPKVLSLGVVPPPIPRPDEANVRLPTLGATAPPVLAPMGPGGQLDILQAGWNGYLYAWSPTGDNLPGWPVDVTLPAGTKPPSGYVLEADHKLDTPPAVTYFQKGGPPDLVMRSQYTEIQGSGLQQLPFSFTFAYSSTGKLLAGWPVRLVGALEFYGSAQEFITEGSDAPAAADILGNGTDEVAVNPVWTPPSVLDKTGQSLYSYGDLLSLASVVIGLQNDPLAAVEHKLPPGTTDIPFPFTSSGAYGKVGGKLVYAQTDMGAESMAASLLYPGTENHINDYTSVWAANQANNPTPVQQAGFPAADQGQSFLAGPIVAPVAAGGDNAVVAGGDDSAVMASTAGGKEAPGFPKFTGGWTTYSPTAGDLFGDGHTDLVTITREGYLFAWATGGSASTPGQWWRFRHDEWNSGNYDLSTRPPGVVRDPVWAPGDPFVRFVAPGGEWYDGGASYYQLTVQPGGKSMRVPAHVVAGDLQSLAVPEAAQSVTIQAVGTGGLLGATVTVRPGSGQSLAKGSFDGPVVGVAETSTGHGYWEATAAGALYAFGDARYLGRIPSTATNGNPVVGIAASPGDGGYWLLRRSGQVTAFGAATRFGATPAGRYVGIAPTPDGRGLWLATDSGAVVSLGDAGRYGSMAGRPLAAPVIGIAATADGRGYWLAGADGGVFSFGDARFAGSMVGKHLSAPIVALAPAGPGGGYWLAAADGGVFAFGARYVGSGATGDLGRGVTALTAAPDGPDGTTYRLATSWGESLVFCDVL
jgi:hypothetical protein